MRAWKVVHYILGADKPEEAYFMYKEDANEFYWECEYSDKPEPVNISKKEAKRMREEGMLL